MSFDNNRNFIPKPSSPSKHSKQGPASPRRIKILEDLKKIVAFENSMASQAKDDDILRACDLFHKTKKKTLRTKISEIFFN